MDEPPGDSLRRLQTYLLPAFTRQDGGASGSVNFNTAEIVFSKRGRFWVRGSETFRLEILNSEGVVQKTITQPFARQPYSEAERKAEKSHPAIILNGTPFYAELPEFKQDIQRIFYAGESRLWVLTALEKIWLPLPGQYTIFRMAIYGDQSWWLGRNAQEETVLFRARIVKLSV